MVDSKGHCHTLELTINLDNEAVLSLREHSTHYLAVVGGVGRAGAKYPLPLAMQWSDNSRFLCVAFLKGTHSPHIYKKTGI